MLDNFSLETLSQFFMSVGLVAPLMIVGIGVFIGLIIGVANVTLGAFLSVVQTLVGDSVDDDDHVG